MAKNTGDEERDALGVVEMTFANPDLSSSYKYLLECRKHLMLEVDGYQSELEINWSYRES